MELAFDDCNLLVPGVHEVTMDTVKEHFGKFQRSDRRMKLFVKLTEYLDAVKKAISGTSVILDGSFVMACVDEPGDVDVLLVLPADWDMQADLKPYQYNLVSKRIMKKAYRFDVFVVNAGSVEEAKWIDFFSQVEPKWSEFFGWPDSLQKGILRILL
jgi:hypothetical protein